MKPAQKTSWGKLCASLPSSLTELELHGFDWEDAAHGLGKIRIRSIKTSYFNLAAPSSLPDASTLFTNTLSDLTHFSFPSSWWFQNGLWSFDGSSLLRDTSIQSVTTFSSSESYQRVVQGRIADPQWLQSMKTLLRSRDTLEASGADSHLFLGGAPRLRGVGMSMFYFSVFVNITTLYP